MIPATQTLGPCPCETPSCSVVGTKIARVSGHLVGCDCASCRNRNNFRRGRRGAARGHKALDGSGFTPFHEESGRFYDLTVRPEIKTGYPAQTKKLREFTASAWFLGALKQCSSAIPEGIDAKPAVMFVWGSKTWLLADVTPKVKR